MLSNDHNEHTCVPTPSTVSTQDVAAGDHLETCVICLSPLSDRAIAYPCNHLTFDLPCLLSWLSHRPTCPLCTAPVTRVEHDFRSPSDYQRLYIPQPPAPSSASSPSSSGSSTTTTRPPRPPRHQPRSRFHRPATPPESDAALARRRDIHLRKAYSLHRQPTHALTPSCFRQPAQQRRARLFLRRELRVFTFLVTSGRLEFVLEYILGMLARLELKGADGALEGLVAEILGREEATLTLHELAGWMGSAFDRLEDWDRGVQYAEEGRKQRT